MAALRKKPHGPKEPTGSGTSRARAALGTRLARLRERTRRTFSREHLAELFSARSFRAGSYAVASCVAVIAISVAVVLAMQALPTRLTSIDISRDQTTSISDEGGYVLVPLAHGIRELDQYRSSLQITSLLTTSDTAYVKTDAANAETLEREEGDVARQTALGVAISEAVEGTAGAGKGGGSEGAAGSGSSEGGGGGAETRVVWFSSSSFLDPTVDLRVGGTNSELFVSALAWLGHSDISTSTLASRGLGTSTLTIDSSVASALSVLEVGIVPAAFLATGFWIWRARRVA